MILKNKKKYNELASEEKMSMESSLAIAKTFSKNAGGCDVTISFRTKSGFKTIYYNAKENKLSDALPEMGKLMLIPVEKHESPIKVIYED